MLSDVFIYVLLLMAFCIIRRQEERSYLLSLTQGHPLKLRFPNHVMNITNGRQCFMHWVLESDAT